MTLTPRKNPCPSCPYRCGVPAGIWHPEEYAKLALYDGDIPEQGSVRMFMCHQGEGDVCAGWLGHKEYPTDLLAVRLACAREEVGHEVTEYTTEVPLFASGAQAAAHGMSGVLGPDEKASAMIDKIIRKRDL